jgi:enoyl-CoA hydratase/carnithine racemase
VHLLKKDNLNITEGRLVYLAQKTRYVNINDYILRGIGMSYETIDWQQNGHVVVATLNRPESLNAMNNTMGQELMDALTRLRDDDSVRVMVLTGAGERSFCAGDDLKERDAGETELSAGPGSVLSGGKTSYHNFDTGKPIIAAVNGYALGGGFELALACDIRVASKNASFGAPEVALGFFPGGGAPLRLPRMMPGSIAMEMLLTGDRFDAETAYRWGLVSHLVEQDELLNTATSIAERIANHAPLAVRAVRELAYGTNDMTLSQVQRMSAFSRWIIQQTDDAQEGPRAFVEKRQPEYHGR